MDATKGSTMALTLGIVGGGQLARMMIARRWSSASTCACSPKKRMSAALAATATGDYRDLDTVRAFARDVDVVTFDHEHVPQDVLRALVADGIRVHPGPDALQFAQDKLAMRARLAELGMPQPEWAAVTDAASCRLPRRQRRARGRQDAARRLRRQGVRVVSDPAEVADWFDGGALLAEELVDFSRELAQQVARRPPVSCVRIPSSRRCSAAACAPRWSHRPARRRASDRGRGLDRHRIAEGLGVTGMLAVELFETTDERLLVNELAMRPHNSGHWSQDGAVTGQFEQHVRAVLDLPLGDPSPRQPWAVMVNILGGPDRFAGEPLSGRARRAPRGEGAPTARRRGPDARWATSTPSATRWMPSSTRPAPPRRSSPTDRLARRRSELQGLAGDTPVWWWMPRRVARATLQLRRVVPPGR
jgi:5-(carboxyamino)imidazole ribonucleotide synthase